MRISGWILPDGSFLDCKPWEHLSFAKTIPWLQEEIARFPRLKDLFLQYQLKENEENLRATIASLGLVKVCYYMVDADLLNRRQLAKLQELYALEDLDAELEFIGKIQAKIPIRIFMKIKDPDRLNMLC